MDCELHALNHSNSRQRFTIGDRVRFTTPVIHNDERITEGQIMRVNGSLVDLSIVIDGDIVFIERYPTELSRI